MPSRRLHTKSRFGCSRCKTRRVKCDEKRPSCANCLRQDVVCNYLTGAPSPSASRATETPSAIRVVPSLSQPGFATVQPTFDLMDLTLMNHFTVVTSLSLFPGEKQRNLWQRHIPFEARSYPLLMHGLLSVASLHMAFLEPKERSAYRIRALYHHNLGLQLFNSQISQISPKNSHVLFTFALMLVIWVYASPAGDKEGSRLDDILDVLDLVRGCRTLFQLHMEAILDKPIGVFYDVNQSPVLPKLPPTSHQVFQNLRTKALDSTHSAAIEQLEVLLQKSIIKPDNTNIVAAWPAIVEDPLWIRLRSHEPFAILIFAHYAIILQRFENRWWWTAGWSKRIIQAAEHALTDTDRVSLGLDLCSGYIQSHGQELASQQHHNRGLSI